MYKYSTTQRCSELNEFITPPELAEAMISLVPETITETSDPIHVLDPGANNGVFGRAIHQRWPFMVVSGVEIMEMPKPVGYNHWLVADFLKEQMELSEYDLIIGNPPYTTQLYGKKTAELFVRKSLSLLRTGGYLVFLLQLGFLASLGRGEGLYKEFPLKSLHISMRRPSFYKYDKRENDHFGKDHTNEYNYAVFIWQKGYKGNFDGSWFNWEYKNGES